jgi:site-specific recombinase
VLSFKRGLKGVLHHGNIYAGIPIAYLVHFRYTVKFLDFKEAKYKAHGGIRMRLESYKYAACAAFWLHRSAMFFVLMGQQSIEVSAG